MKKKFKIWQVVLGVCSLLLVTGCGNNSMESMTCTRTMNQNGIKTSLKYNVEYEGDYVSRIKTVETVKLMILIYLILIKTRLNLYIVLIKM